jgi:hypothetical protein
LVFDLGHTVDNDPAARGICAKSAVRRRGLPPKVANGKALDGQQRHRHLRMQGLAGP